MRLSNPIETSGYFWLPTDSEDRLPGTLQISGSGKVTLELIGTFGDWRLAFQDTKMQIHPLPSGERPNQERIVGIVEKGGTVTLDACIPTGNSIQLPSGLSKSTYHAKFAFIGGNHDAGKKLMFSEVSLFVEGLNEWLSVSWFREEQNRETKSGRIEYQLPEDIAFKLPNGVELSIKHLLSPPSFGVPSTKVCVAQTSYFGVKLECPQPIGYFLPLVVRLCNFLSLAIDQPVSISSISGYLDQKSETARMPQSPTEIYYQASPNVEVKPEIQFNNMLFTCGNIVDQCEQVLTKWLEVYDTFEPALNLYFASRSDALQSYLEVRFLRLAQGIETLHRRNSQDTEMPEDEFNELKQSIIGSCPAEKKQWLERELKYANELSLRQRIKAMIQPFQPWFGSQKESRRLVNLVVDTRNYLTHYDSELAIRDSYVDGLWYLCEKLEALFQLHFLRLIGIDPKPIVERQNKLAKKLKLKL